MPTSSYFENQDVFGQWLDEKFDHEPGNEFKTATSGDLYSSWAAYAKAAGEPAGGAPRLQTLSPARWRARLARRAAQAIKYGEVW